MGQNSVIVSLTSIKKRELSLKETLESLVGQITTFDFEVRVYLSNTPYLLDEGFDCEPEFIQQLANKNSRCKIKCCFVENSGPFRKILPLLDECFEAHFDPLIVTTDDDIKHHESWLQNLVEKYNIHKTIVASRGHAIVFKDEILPYSNWTTYPKQVMSLMTLPTNGAGTVYRPGHFHRKVTDVKAAMKIAPTADDLWLRWHTISKFEPVTLLNTNNVCFEPTENFVPEISLWEQYNELEGNDSALLSLEDYLKELLGFNVGDIAREVQLFANLNPKVDLKYANLFELCMKRVTFLSEADDESTLYKISASSYEMLASRISNSLTSSEYFPIVSSGVKKKLIMGVKTWNRIDYIKEFIDTFTETCNRNHQWTLVVADDGSTDGTLEFLDSLDLDIPLVVLKNSGAYASGQFNSVNDYAMEAGFDVCFHSDDDVIFIKKGWDDLYLRAMDASGFQHLCYKNYEQHLGLMKRQKSESFELPEPSFDDSGLCSSIVDVMTCGGAFFTVTPELLNNVGYADEVNFPIRGQWHIDYSVRCVRAGFNERNHFFDAHRSNEFITSQESREGYRCSLPWNEQYKSTKDQKEIERRYSVINMEDRIFVGKNGRAEKVQRKLIDAKPFTNKEHLQNLVSLNEFVDKAFVINLDRRPDRLKSFNRQVRKLGLDVQRVSAVDGSLPKYSAEYQKYCELPPVKADREIRYTKEFYVDRNFSENDRIAYLEKDGKKAIRSVGAWAYLKTYINILEDALQSGCNKIAVFDDDALFSKNFIQDFSKLAQQIPENWKIFLLGAMQYNWDEGWISHFSKDLYHCNGTSVASHAVCLNRDAMQLLLEACLKYPMPLDVGPLSYVQRVWSEECFVANPNIVIQDNTESDIDTSENLGEGTNSNNLFRWELDNFVL